MQQPEKQKIIKVHLLYGTVCWRRVYNEKDDLCRNMGCAECLRRNMDIRASKGVT